MIDAATNQANLGSAAQLTKINLGLDGIAAGDWSVDQRAAYVATLASTILNYPQSFDAATLQTAQIVAAQNLAPSAGQWSSDWAEFSYYLDNSVDDVNQNFVLLGSGAAKLLGHVGNIAGNLGAAGEKAAATASYGWVVPVGVIAFFALAIASGARETRRAITG